LDTYSLYDLNEYIKRVISLNFQEPIWISCEIAQCKINRGHVYIDLVQQDDKDEVIAQASAVIWYKSYLFLKNKLKDVLDQLLQIGTEVRIKVKVEYNERYGMKYVIEDIDPAFTLGQLEINKQRIIERLTKEEIIHINKEKARPRVIKKIAIISSEEAAGYADFKKKISHNSYGYAFQLTFFAAAMQGVNTESEVVAALQQINVDHGKYDVAIIIRGGGSKLDLSYFDNYAIAKAISASALPIFTGIGHDIDLSITDIVANKSFITPTAVADYIIENNLHFESQIIDITQAIGGLCGMVLKTSQMSYQSTVHQVKELPKSILLNEKHQLVSMYKDILISKNQTLNNIKQGIVNINSIIELVKPEKILKRGYAIIKDANGGYITTKSQVAIGHEVTMVLTDGAITSKVTRI
jgi:exodeoxyribonuclease VII large subunit